MNSDKNGGRLFSCELIWGGDSSVGNWYGGDSSLDSRGALRGLGYVTNKGKNEFLKEVYEVKCTRERLREGVLGKRPLVW